MGGVCLYHMGNGSTEVFKNDWSIPFCSLVVSNECVCVCVCVCTPCFFPL